jgi:hypothetical protein
VYSSTNARAVAQESSRFQVTVVSSAPTERYRVRRFKPGEIVVLARDDGTE